GAMIAFAIVAALHLFPPAWSPAILLTAVISTHTLALLICMGLAQIIPILALQPDRVNEVIPAGLALFAHWLPIAGFLRVLPAIAELYGHPLRPGWGFGVMIVGLAGIIGAAGYGIFTQRAR